ncbi:MAG: hypothetical protein FJZ01_05730 [Candidatus Sericytochromatia bacterium]|nr:hypothetical protein [Candidatus Tanganyikabacteria bacterium]
MGVVMGINGFGSIFSGLVRRGIQQLPALFDNVMPWAGGRPGKGGPVRGQGMPSLLQLF